MPGFFKARVDVYDCARAIQRSDNKFDRLVHTEIEKLEVSELISPEEDENKDDTPEE